MMNANDRYLSSISRLPAVPSLAVELLSFFKNPDRDLDEIVKVISLDPALTVEILRRCNSAFFAPEHPAVSVFEALTRLGFYEVYCTVAALLAASASSLPGIQEGLDVQQLWQHLVTTAAAASEVAETAGEPKEVAFTSGLLHDIGKLVLASAERARYASLQQECRVSGVSLLQAEEAAFGVNHAGLGGCLLARWKLPPDISTAVILHHSSGDGQPFVKLAAIVQTANLVAHHLERQYPGAMETDSATAATLERLKISPDQLASVIAKTERAVSRMEGLMPCKA